MSQSVSSESSEHVSDYNDAVRAEQCHFCPARHDLQTHHIVPRRKNGSNSQENLVIVCEDCHQKLEAIYDKRFYERLGLSDERGAKRSHYACFLVNCPNTARLNIRTKAGSKQWFCEDHGRPLLDSDGWELVEEVTADG